MGKLIGLLFLFCLPLLSILFLKTTVMGTIFLRIRVLTRNACLQLAYVPPLDERVLNRHMQEAPHVLGYAHKKSCAYHHVFKSIESLGGDRGMDNIFINIFQNTVPFKVFFFYKVHYRNCSSSKRI